MTDTVDVSVTDRKRADGRPARPNGTVSQQPRLPVGLPRRLIAIGVCLAALALAVPTLSNYWLFIGGGFFATVIAAVSLNLLFGYGKQIVIAQAAFAGIGAYGFALGIRHGWPPLAAAVVAVLATGVLASLVALPALRLEGLYLGIATLVLQFGFSGVLEAWVPVTGGQEGLAISSIRRDGFASLDHDQFWFILSGIAAIVVVAAFARFLRGTGGRALASLGEAPHAAQSLGARPFVWRLSIFAVSGMLAGVAGVFVAGQAAFVSPASFSVDQTLLYFLAIIIGGVGRVGGPVIGAAIVVGLPRWLENLGFASSEPVVFPILVLAGLILLPSGLIGLPDLIKRLISGRRRPAAEAL